MARPCFKGYKNFIVDLDKLGISDLKMLIEHLKNNKLKVKPYLEERLKRHDLFSSEPIEYKAPEQYVTALFSNKVNCRKFFESLSVTEKFDLIDIMLMLRKFTKSIKKMPCEIESKTLVMPSISYLIKNQFPISQASRISGLHLPFNYVTKPTFRQRDKILVMRDTREKKPLVNQAIDFEIQKLRFGDYAAVDNPHRIFFERKTLPDFIGTVSLNIDRFRNEIQRAKDVDCKLIVLVESPLNTCLNYHRMKFYWRLKVKPEYAFHNVRQLIAEYDNLQFLFVDGRKEAGIVMKKVYCMNEDPFSYDLQFLYNVKTLC